MAARRTTSFRAVSDAVLAIAAERTVQGGLRRMVDAARDLSGARYAALGIPDNEGGFRQFLTAGISEQRAAEIGPLPRTHGMLGAMLETTQFLSQPRPAQGSTVRGLAGATPDHALLPGRADQLEGRRAGRLLPGREAAPRRVHDDDRARIELLAAHAAVAIENARLYERNRELVVVAERNRLARDLHDAVAQKLFSAALTAETAATLVERDAAAAKVEMRRAGELLSEATAELRALIFELRPPELDRDGLQETLRKHVDVLRRVERAPVELDISCDGRLPAKLEEGFHRIAQEALHNAVRHARAGRIDVRLGRGDGRVRLEVCDDGVGFDPADARLRARHLGLTSMEERAAELGAEIAVISAPGAGTSVTVVADG